MRGHDDTGTAWALDVVQVERQTQEVEVGVAVIGEETATSSETDLLISLGLGFVLSIGGLVG